MKKKVRINRIEKKRITSIIDEIINDYLNANSTLRHLFNEDADTAEVRTFFNDNFPVILGTMGRLFHESKTYQTKINELYSMYLEQIETDYDEFLKKNSIKAYQKRIRFRKL